MRANDTDTRNITIHSVRGICASIKVVIIRFDFKEIRVMKKNIELQDFGCLSPPAAAILDLTWTMEWLLKALH